MKGTVTAVLPKIVSVSCDKDHLCFLQRAKKFSQYLQFTRERLTVEQVSGDQQKIDLFQIRLIYQTYKAVINFFSACFAPGKTAVRHCSQMDI